MSEKIIAELKKEDRDLLKSAIDAVSKPKVNQPTGDPVPVTESTDAKGHKTIEEQIACPDCYPKIREAVFKKHAEETQDSGWVCEGCGLGVREEWEECPNCKSKDAKER